MLLPPPSSAPSPSLLLRSRTAPTAGALAIAGTCALITLNFQWATPVSISLHVVSMLVLVACNAFLEVSLQSRASLCLPASLHGNLSLAPLCL